MDFLRYFIRHFLPVAIVVILAVLFSSLLKNFNQKTAGSSDETFDSFLAPEHSAVFEPVLPGASVRLPEDFRFHPEFQQESWHYIASLKDKTGKQYGVQWNFIRIATDERASGGWQTPQLYMATVVITSGDNVWRHQRIARGGIGQAGLRPRPFRLWLDNWVWRSISNMPLPGILKIETDSFGLSLSSTSMGPYVLEGEDGYVRKHDLLPLASYGIKAPFLAVSGQLNLDGKVVNVTGDAWLNKEWSSDYLDSYSKISTQFSLKLEDGSALTLNRLEVKGQSSYTYGVVSDTNGQVTNIKSDNIRLTPMEYYSMKNGKLLPLKWAVKIPEYGIDTVLKPLIKELWHPFITPYWEGPVISAENKKVRGYLHLEGY